MLPSASATCSAVPQLERLVQLGLALGAGEDPPGPVQREVRPGPATHAGQLDPALVAGAAPDRLGSAPAPARPRRAAPSPARPPRPGPRRRPHGDRPASDGAADGTAQTWLPGLTHGPDLTRRERGDYQPAVVGVAPLDERRRRPRWRPGWSCSAPGPGPPRGRRWPGRLSSERLSSALGERRAPGSARRPGGRPTRPVTLRSSSAGDDPVDQAQPLRVGGPQVVAEEHQLLGPAAGRPAGAAARRRRRRGRGPGARTPR